MKTNNDEKRQDSTKNETDLNTFFDLETSDPERKLHNFFSKKKIYLDIFNEGKNINEIYANKITKYKAIILRNLNKHLDYIVFKDGHIKTKRYSYLNDIKIVNPLWIYDKVNNHLFKDDNDYKIVVNYDHILFKKNNNYENNFF